MNGDARSKWPAVDQRDDEVSQASMASIQTPVFSANDELKDIKKNLQKH